MGLGDMSFHNLKSSTMLESNRERRESNMRTTRRVALVFLLLGGALLLGSATGLAKDKTPKTRTVTGVVFDDAGNTIDGATVELIDLQTNQVVDISSQEQGDYKFTDIRFDHDYT